MSTGLIVAVVTLVVVAAVYMAYTMGEITEIRRTLERIERRQKLPIMQARDTPRAKRRDIEVMEPNEL